MVIGSEACDTTVALSSTLSPSENVDGVKAKLMETEGGVAGAMSLQCDS